MDANIETKAPVLNNLPPLTVHVEHIPSSTIFLLFLSRKQEKAERKNTNPGVVVGWVRGRVQADPAIRVYRHRTAAGQRVVSVV